MRKEININVPYLDTEEGMKYKILTGTKKHHLFFQDYENIALGDIINFNEVVNKSFFPFYAITNIAEIMIEEEENRSIIRKPLVFAMEDIELCVEADNQGSKKIELAVSGFYMSSNQSLMSLFALNEGRDLTGLIKYLVEDVARDRFGEKIKGKLIHWTSQFYDKHKAVALSKIPL